MTEGTMIVLTASDVEMSDFSLDPFIAFSGGFPPPFPLRLLRKILYRNVVLNDDGTVKYAPYGLRKVETLLINEFGEKNVATVHPRFLDNFVGSKTKIVGISTMDPLGLGFVSRTYSNILDSGRDPITKLEFNGLLRKITSLRHKPNIIVGGSGAWQIMKMQLENRFPIDTIIIGEAEHSIANVFRRVLAGDKLEKVIMLEKPGENEIPLIMKPSLYGTVEITRGCNRGCNFCSPTTRQLYSFPLEHILSEARLNARNGSKMIVLQTEDIFLYKTKHNFLPNKTAITNLVRRISEIEGVDYIQIAHASLAPVVYDKTIVEEMAPLLYSKSRWRRWRFASVEIGVETGSARLMKIHMRGKTQPYESEKWQDIVATAVDVLNDNQIYPLATLILGLPGEEYDDVVDTIGLLDRLGDAKIFYVPLLFTSEKESALEDMYNTRPKELSEVQWEVLAKCWEHNWRVWLPQIRYLMPSILLAYPLYRIKYGKKIFRPMMRFSGVQRLLERSNP